ncbi:DUF2711 family protein [Xanthobacteraceae bacterium A53D]
MDRRFVAPPYDTAILPHYAGLFDAAFVALHPFFRLPGMDPADCLHGTQVFERAEVPEGVSLRAHMAAGEAERRAGKALDEDAVDLAAKAGGQKVSWREMVSRTGLADHRDLNRALRTHIKALKPEFADEAAATRLVEVCAGENLFLPTEGAFQPLMERSLVALFAACGCSQVIVGDEFGDEAVPVALAALEEDRPWHMTPAWPPIAPRRLVAEDGSLMACVDWDSFFILILGTRARFGQVDPASLFEGFWCGPETELSWQRQPLRPLDAGR